MQVVYIENGFTETLLDIFLSVIITLHNVLCSGVFIVSGIKFIILERFIGEYKLLEKYVTMFRENKVYIFNFVFGIFRKNKKIPDSVTNFS